MCCYEVLESFDGFINHGNSGADFLILGITIVYAFWESLREGWKAGQVMLRDLAEEEGLFYYTIMRLTYHGAISEIRRNCLDFLANRNCYTQGLVNFGTVISLSCLNAEPDHYRSEPERDDVFNVGTELIFEIQCFSSSVPIVFDFRG
jgi:hypothetical protein